jgi:hypothetical protein
MISSGLAAAYQTLQEGSRALNPFGDTFLRFPTAMQTAQQQATQNIEGILAAESNNLTPQQQADRNKYLAALGQPADVTTAQQSNVIPNFEKLSDGSYRDTRSGDIYGSETYGSIAAGMYPDIYNPNQKPTMADVAGPAATGGGYAGDTKNVVSEDPLGLIQQINKLRNGQTPYANYSYQPEEGGYVAWNGTSYSVVNPEQIKRDIEAIQGLASGGRVGYAYGSGLKLAQLLQKAGKSLKQAIKEAVDNINPTGDKKLDADMAVDDMLETYSIDRDAVDGYDILNAYDEAYKTIANPKTMSEVETLEAMGANITAKTLELVEKYPGLNSDLARKIASDPDPQRQAEVISTIEQAFELMKQGKSSDEVLDIMKQMTDRTKQAGGGLSYLSGF